LSVLLHVIVWKDSSVVSKNDIGPLYLCQTARKTSVRENVCNNSKA